MSSTFTAPPIPSFSMPPKLLTHARRQTENKMKWSVAELRLSSDVFRLNPDNHGLSNT